MDRELHFHRCFVRTNYLPRIMTMEPWATTNAIQLFIEEAIGYVFSFRGINDCVIPNSIEALTAAIPEEVYFDPYVGQAINHQCAIDDASRFAEEYGYAEDQWLQLPGKQAKKQIAYYLEVIGAKTSPANLSIINMLAFTAYLSFQAMRRERTDLITPIIWGAVPVFQRRFPLQWIYYDVRQWAMAYNVRHHEIHNKLILEDPFEEYIELKLPREDPTMDVLPTLYFVESAIDHFLRTHLFLFNWSMPVNLKLLEQKIPDKKFFDPIIGKAIAHKCAMSFSFGVAQTHGFTQEIWSEMEGQDFRKYTQRYLDVVRSETKPVNLSLIHMLSFAAVLCSLAIHVGRDNVMNDIVWSVVHKIGECFPYEWIFESLHHWALTYNFRHNDIDETWVLEDCIEEGLDEVAGDLIVGWKD